MKPYIVRLYNLLQKIWHKVKNITFRVQSRVNSISTELILSWSRLWQRPNIEGYLRNNQQHDQFKLHFGWWLTKNILFLEGESLSNTFLGKQLVKIVSDKQLKIAQSVFFSLDNNQQAGLIFLKADRKRCKETWHMKKDHPIAKDSGREFIDYLDTNREERRLKMRDALGSILFEHCPFSLQAEAKVIFERLSLVQTQSSYFYHRPSLPFFFTVDKVIPAGQGGWLFIGWKYDPHNLLRSLTVTTPLGLSETVTLDELYPYPRPDVFHFLQQRGLAISEQAYGFCAYVSTSSSIDHRWPINITVRQPRLTLHLTGDYDITLNPLAKSSDPFINRQTLVQFPHSLRLNWDIVEQCLTPAAQALQEACNQQVRTKEVEQYGEPVKKPIVSILIPLYRQLDFLSAQLAALGNDPDIKKRAEIIYILDSPEQQSDVENRLLQSSTLYNLPLKLVVMNCNSGYSNANNYGAKEARGKYFLLLNSDVLPIKKGWLKKMVDFYRSTPNIGALGPKLLYPDNTVQNVGLYFILTNPHYWLNAAYNHCFPVNFSELRKSRTVPAVTGACLMIKSNLYHRLKGLSNEYIIGNFEDTDFCLKCIAVGLNNWYYSGTTLYHLENQSMPLNTANQTFTYEHNAYLQTKKWNTTIKKIMRKYDT